MERVRSYVRPDATFESKEMFDIPALVSDPLLRACFLETLRLRSQNGSKRVVNEATTIPVHGKRYYIRKGSIAYIPAPLIHMDSDIYSNVNEFRPERFFDVDVESTLIQGELEDSLIHRAHTSGKKAPKFFKKGVRVKHYLMPFGGGDNLVLVNFRHELIKVYRSDICPKGNNYPSSYVFIFI